MKNNLPAWGVALAACVPLLATAQGARTDSPKTAPQLTYRSAFADYKPYKDAPLANWRDVNDTVAGGASGHAGHSMGAMEGTEMPGAPAAPASAPMRQMAMPMSMPMNHAHPKTGGKP